MTILINIRSRQLVSRFLNHLWDDQSLIRELPLTINQSYIREFLNDFRYNRDQMELFIDFKLSSMSVFLSCCSNSTHYSPFFAMSDLPH